MSRHSDDEMARQGGTPPQFPAALTAEEWGQQIAHDVQFSRTSGHGEIGGHIYVTLADVTDGGPEANGETEAVEIHWGTVETSSQLWNRYKLAALCLYQQPFGFTREDVVTLEEWSRPMADSGNVFAQIEAEHIRQIAARIAALLPPEDRAVGNAGEVPADGAPSSDNRLPEEK